jgi:hypothetical protein
MWRLNETVFGIGHTSIKPFMREVVRERQCIDYETLGQCKRAIHGR